jgi:hypothetical protein
MRNARVSSEALLLKIPGERGRRVSTFRQAFPLQSALRFLFSQESGKGLDGLRACTPVDLRADPRVARETDEFFRVAHSHHLIFRLGAFAHYQLGEGLLQIRRPSPRGLVDEDALSIDDEYGIGQSVIELPYLVTDSWGDC